MSSERCSAGRTCDEKPRDVLAYELAKRLYDRMTLMIRDEEPDAGIGIAACALVGQWLSASATAQVIAHDPTLANVPYLHKSRKDEQ